MWGHVVCTRADRVRRPRHALTGVLASRLRCDLYIYPRLRAGRPILQEPTSPTTPHPLRCALTRVLAAALLAGSRLCRRHPPRRIPTLSRSHGAAAGGVNLFHRLPFLLHVVS